MHPHRQTETHTQHNTHTHTRTHTQHAHTYTHILNYSQLVDNVHTCHTTCVSVVCNTNSAGQKQQTIHSGEVTETEDKSEESSFHLSLNWYMPTTPTHSLNFHISSKHVLNNRCWWSDIGWFARKCLLQRTTLHTYTCYILYIPINFQFLYFQTCNFQKSSSYIKYCIGSWDKLMLSSWQNLNS